MKKRIICTILAFIFALSLVPFSALAYLNSRTDYYLPDLFYDVSQVENGKKNPFYESILYAAATGITTGYSDGTFRPNDTCTRGHVVTFLWRAAGEPEPASYANSFSDVSQSSPFYTAILWAAENGITTGYSDGTFRPGAACTRAHVVTFLWRSLGKPAPEGTVSLNDIADLNGDFRSAITWAASTGITTGYSDGGFRPNAVCTRAHVVTFLFREIKYAAELWLPATVKTTEADGSYTLTSFTYDAYGNLLYGDTVDQTGKLVGSSDMYYDEFPWGELMSTETRMGDVRTQIEFYLGDVATENIYVGDLLQSSVAYNHYMGSMKLSSVVANFYDAEGNPDISLITSYYHAPDTYTDELIAKYHADTDYVDHSDPDDTVGLIATSYTQPQLFSDRELTPDEQKCRVDYLYREGLLIWEVESPGELYAAEHEIRSVTNHSYDGNLLPKHDKTTDADGKLLSSTDYYYNSDLLLVKQVYTDLEAPENSLTSEYTYDENLNVLTETFTSGDGSVQTIEYTYFRLK